MSPDSSPLNVLIPPEIKNDPFYAALVRVASDPEVRTILEIGASSGGGSTEALSAGAAQNPSRPTIYSIEVSTARFQALRTRYQGNAQVKPYNVSSVPTEKFPSPAEVTAFYQGTLSALNRYPLEQVLSWLAADTAYLRDSGVPQDGIERIRRENGIEKFDAVLIDGSEFTGVAELELVYGAGLVLLDDVAGFKNLHNLRRLADDPNYALVEYGPNVRNGYAIFRHRDFRVGRYETIAPAVEGVEGFMVAGQEKFLFEKVASLPEDAVIVEIGSFKGRSTVAMGHACVGTRRRIYCIDTWDGNESDFAQRNFFDAWRANVESRRLGDYVVPLRGMSHEVLISWSERVGAETAGREFDFIFIDGSHVFEDVLRDFQISLPRVKVGGWVAFHDVVVSWPGPLRVWGEYAVRSLTDHQYSTTLACGRKAPQSQGALDELLARPIDPLPVHFFTTVHNGGPEIRRHIEQFMKLPFEWRWHIMEGVVAPTYSAGGLSTDGTTQYLDELARQHGDRVVVYRKVGGAPWQGRFEMANAPLQYIFAECLLWEIGADDGWTAEQIQAGRKLFLEQPAKTAAVYRSEIPAAPGPRTWRYRPGMVWAAHEPPVLAEQFAPNQWRDAAAVNPLTVAQTEAAGLVWRRAGREIERAGGYDSPFPMHTRAAGVFS